MRVQNEPERYIGMANSTIEARLAKLKKQRQQLAEQEKELLRQSKERKLAKIITVVQNAQLSPLELNQLIEKIQLLLPKIKENGINPIKYGIRYVNPEQPNQKWGGRGRPPEWVKRFAQSDRLKECVHSHSSNEN